MRASRSIFIAAPIEDVFAFFDDPANTSPFQDDGHRHVDSIVIAELRPDGRRMFDLHMSESRSRWIQTIDQDVREPPTRLTSHGWTWTTDRNSHLLTQHTDLRFSEEGEGTRVVVTAGVRVERPWRYPWFVVAAWLWGYGDAKTGFEHSLHFIAEHLEAR